MRAYWADAQELGIEGAQTLVRTNTSLLWLRWVAANAMGELLGLGTTFAATALAFSRLDSQPGAGAVLVSFLFAVSSGTIEATLVGLGQWQGRYCRLLNG